MPRNIAAAGGTGTTPIPIAAHPNPMTIDPDANYDHNPVNLPKSYNLSSANRTDRNSGAHSYQSGDVNSFWLAPFPCLRAIHDSHRIKLKISERLI